MSLKKINRLLIVRSFAQGLMWPLAFIVVALHELGHLIPYLRCKSGGAWKIAIGTRVDQVWQVVVADALPPEEVYELNQEILRARQRAGVT